MRLRSGKKLAGRDGGGIITRVPAVDIYAHHRAREDAAAVSSCLMARQAELNGNMRAILVDWLVDVQRSFRLSAPAVHLAVSLLDRFTAMRTIRVGDYQLIGATALFIASKYEEVYPPEIRDFAWMGDNSFTVTQILETERAMLAALNFELALPHAYIFLGHLVDRAGIAPDGPEARLSHYLADLTLQHECLLDMPASCVAAAALYLARQSANGSSAAAWPGELAVASGYTECDLEVCVSTIARIRAAAPTDRLQAVRRKHAATGVPEAMGAPPVAPGTCHALPPP